MYAFTLIISAISLKVTDCVPELEFFSSNSKSILNSDPRCADLKLLFNLYLKKK
jgi:hypothetical protein